MFAEPLSKMYDVFSLDYVGNVGLITLIVLAGIIIFKLVLKSPKKK